jgi:isoquinoline 1-oxidoreductase beta subunit
MTDTGSIADGGSSRRKFLRATSSLGGGLLLSFALPPFTRHANATGTVGAEGFAPNGFVRVNRDGRVILTMPQVEMG